MAGIGPLIPAALQFAGALGMEVPFTRVPATGAYDGFGQPLYGPSTTLTGFWDPTRRRITAITGEEIVSQGSAVFPPLPVITPQDQFTLPDGSLGTVAALRSYQIAQGLIFQHVFFGR